MKTKLVLLKVIIHVTTCDGWQSIDRLVLSLHAEKVFDHAEWLYLFYTLHTFGLSEKFIR